MSTFHTGGLILQDFGDHIYVRCPHCARCAHVIALYSASVAYKVDKSRLFAPRKLSCLHCGYAKSWAGHQVSLGGAYDWYFRQPLWLQTPCGGETLWALNPEHLDFLEQYVAAKQRRHSYVPGAIRNAKLVSRLPLWIKGAHQRERVLQGLARLKHLLEKA